MNSWIIIGVLVTVMGSGAYFYFTTTQHKIQQLASNVATLESNNKQLQTAINKSNETVDYLQNSYSQIQDQYNAAQADLQTIRSQNDELRQKLGQHDLGILAENKPFLVEKIINTASKKANRCFELLSGAPLTEEEKNAKNEKEFNSECPFLFNNLSTP